MNKPYTITSLPPFIWTIQILLFISCIIFSDSASQEGGEKSSIILIIARLSVIFIVLFIINNRSLKEALCIFVSFVFFQPSIPNNSLYLSIMFVIGSIILWNRFGKPNPGLPGLLFFIMSVSIAYNYFRDPEADTYFMLLNMSIWYSCGILLSGISKSNDFGEIDSDLIVLTIGVTSALTVIASFVWVYLYDDIYLLFTQNGTSRLGEMGLKSTNTTAAAWSIGLLALGVFSIYRVKSKLVLSCMFICLLGIISTRTWGATIIMCVFFIIILYYLFRKQKFILYTVFLLTIIFFTNSKITDLISCQFNVEGKDIETLSSRFLAWEAAYNGLFILPFGHTMAEWNTIAPSSKDGYLTPHNIILQTGILS